MNGIVQQQATMLSYLDVFYIFTFGTLFVVALVLCLKRVKRRPGAEPVMAH